MSYRYLLDGSWVHTSVVNRPQVYLNLASDVNGSRFNLIFLSITWHIPLRIISRVFCSPALKKAAFSLRLDFAIVVNRHIFENEYGDLSFFCYFESSNKFLFVKLTLSVEHETCREHEKQAIVAIFMVLQ